MLGDITAADEIYIVTGRTDMRKSIDGLCAIVEDQLHMDPRWEDYQVQVIGHGINKITGGNYQFHWETDMVLKKLKIC